MAQYTITMPTYASTPEQAEQAMLPFYNGTYTLAPGDSVLLDYTGCDIPQYGFVIRLFGILENLGLPYDYIHDGSAQTVAVMDQAANVFLDVARTQVG